MTDFVNYLLNVASYVYTIMLDRWGGSVGSDEFTFAFCWILVVIALAMVFVFALVPLLFRWIFNMFGRWGRQ